MMVVILCVRFDAEAVRLECKRPKPAGWDSECRFTSRLNSDGSWSYLAMLTKTNITEQFDLVDLLTSSVKKPEADKKQSKGRFGTSRATNRKIEKDFAYVRRAARCAARSASV